MSRAMVRRDEYIIRDAGLDSTALASRRSFPSSTDDHQSRPQHENSNSWSEDARVINPGGYGIVVTEIPAPTTMKVHGFHCCLSNTPR